MKLTFVLLMFSTFSFAQTKTFETKIDKAGTVNIYGNGKVSVGQIIISTFETKVYLTGMSQTQDSDGKNTTVIELGNNENVPLFGVDILLKFSEPVESVDNQGSGMNVFTSFSEDHTQYQLKASQINRGFQNSDPLIRFVIKSKRPIFTTISGINGALH